MRIEEYIETKGLRRLRDAQARAVRRGLDIAAVADLLDRIGDGHRRHGGTGAAGGGDRARNHRRGHERARGVVDKHDVGLLAGQRFQACMYRGLPCRAAMGRRLMAQARDRLVEDRGVVGVDDRLHSKNVWMAAECFHRPVDYGLAADRTVLLGPACAGAKPAPGCDKDGCCTLRSGHRDSMTGESGLRRGYRAKYHGSC